MIDGVRPIVLTPLVVILAAVLHLRRGGIKDSPLDSWHSISGLLAMSGLVLVGLIPRFWPLLVIIAPAFLSLLARLVRIARTLPTALAIYTRICIAASPLIVTGVFLFVWIFDP